MIACSGPAPVPSAVSAIALASDALIARTPSDTDASGERTMGAPAQERLNGLGVSVAAAAGHPREDRIGRHDATEEIPIVHNRDGIRARGQHPPRHVRQRVGRQARRQRLLSHDGVEERAVRIASCRGTLIVRRSAAVGRDVLFRRADTSG